MNFSDEQFVGDGQRLPVNFAAADDKDNLLVPSPAMLNRRFEAVELSGLRAAR